MQNDQPTREKQNGWQEKAHYNAAGYLSAH